MKDSEKESNKSNKTKKYIIAGAAVTATVLAAVGAYTLQKHLKNKATKDIMAKGEKVVNECLKRAENHYKIANTTSFESAMLSSLQLGAMEEENSKIAKNKATEAANKIGKSVVKSYKYLRKKEQGRYDTIFK